MPALYKRPYNSQTNSTGWFLIAVSNFSYTDTANIGRWVCIEMELLLNTTGKKNGLYRIWADDSMIAERTNIDIGARGDKYSMV